MHEFMGLNPEKAKTNSQSDYYKKEREISIGEQGLDGQGLDLGLNLPYTQKDPKNDKFPLFALTEKMADQQGMQDLQKRGFLIGNFKNDLNVTQRIGQFIFDYGKSSLFYLEQILNSRHKANSSLASKYKNLSFNKLKQKIKSGEISDPYPLKEIEKAFIEAMRPGESTTTLPTEIHSIPVWWKELSPEFRVIIGNEFEINGKKLSEVIK